MCQLVFAMDLTQLVYAHSIRGAKKTRNFSVDLSHSKWLLPNVYNEWGGFLWNSHVLHPFGYSLPKSSLPMEHIAKISQAAVMQTDIEKLVT